MGNFEFIKDMTREIIKQLIKETCKLIAMFKISINFLNVKININQNILSNKYCCANLCHDN